MSELIEKSIGSLRLLYHRGSIAQPPRKFVRYDASSVFSSEAEGRLRNPRWSLAEFFGVMDLWAEINLRPRIQLKSNQSHSPSVAYLT